MNEKSGKENYMKGMLMIMISAFCFAGMNVSVRLAGELPSIQKSFFRNMVAAVFAGVIFLGEPFTALSLAASAVIIVGVWGVQRA